MKSEVQTFIFEIPTLDFTRTTWRLDLLRQLNEAGKLDTQSMLRVELALQEAVTNSVEHGNLGLRSEWKEEFDREGLDRFTREKQERLRDPFFALRKVKIAVQYFENVLDISIQDEGDGFEHHSKSPSVGLESYGRGLKMIRSNMDEVSFDDNGRVIRMKKFL